MSPMAWMNRSSFLQQKPMRVSRHLVNCDFAQTVNLHSNSCPKVCHHLAYIPSICRFLSVSSEFDILPYCPTPEIMARSVSYRFDIEEGVENVSSSQTSRFSKYAKAVISFRFLEVLVGILLFGVVVYEFVHHASPHKASFNQTTAINVTVASTLPTTEIFWSTFGGSSEDDVTSTTAVSSNTTDPIVNFTWNSSTLTESQAETATTIYPGTIAPTSTEDYGVSTSIVTFPAITTDEASTEVATTETATEATTKSSSPTDVTTQKVQSFYYNLQERSLRYPVFFEKPDWTECVPKWMDIPEYLDRQWMALQCVQEYKKGTFVVYNTPYPGYTLEDVEKKLMMHCMMGEVFVPCAKVLNGNKIVGSPLASRNCTYCSNKPRN